MKDIIQHRLDSHYNLKTAEDELNALKEITQEVALYALYEVGFFEKACFMGGTCLRIIHSLDRFSEDLDFSTRRVDTLFKLDEYLEKAMDVMAPYGYALTIDEKDLTDRTVQSRFLKDDSIKKVLTFKHQQDNRLKIKIKVEVDTNPPLGASEKTEFIDFPEDFQILAYDLSSLMSGKLHALLCRPYAKGRDWYDYSWYVKNNCSPNLKLLENALNQLGPWKGKNIQVDEKFLKTSLMEKINSLNWSDVKADVRKFLPPEKVQTLDIWGPEFFANKVKKLNMTGHEGSFL
ncbi:MAG: nucleotidyl transferase AbiEii/AbiGii toxin family protein [Bacteriovoracaceae bacterium]|nr:nucleotidyl transferase AbiEii/AbiGii toxin family protein [Bacteriovoracaceae bacterium]